MRYLIVLSLLFLSCNRDIVSRDNVCVDESLIKDGPCTRELYLVCGCDGNTYANLCLLNNAGVLSYTEGECKN
tara:strand:+ start:264 stop:482 length:219 start_codon:yes stop_codon:yes gene_type:complete